MKVKMRINPSSSTNIHLGDKSYMRASLLSVNNGERYVHTIRFDDNTVFFVNRAQLKSLRDAITDHLEGTE